MQNKTLKIAIIVKLQSGVARNEYVHVRKRVSSDAVRVSIVLGKQKSSTPAADR